MTPPQLAAFLPDLFVTSGEVMKLTLRPFFAINAHTAALEAFCMRELGDQGRLTAATMLQGNANATAGASLALARLAELAAAYPDVAEAIRDARYGDLATMYAAAPFNAALKEVIDEYGWRTPTWGEIHLPLWVEQPELALALVRRYLIEPEYSPAAAVARSVRLRDEAVAAFEARLSSEKLPVFRRLLEAAREHVPVSESRASWQLVSGGVVRVPVLTLGRRLVEFGRIAAADDVFYFHIPELQRIAAGDFPDAQAVAIERRAAHERHGLLVPPLYLGPKPEYHPGSGQRLDFTPDDLADRVVTGIAASRGVARGRARLIRGLQDAGRLQAGDILVTSSTAPPWTAMFSLAAAVVTDSGGLLAHSAIAAREYGIPAVIATRNGTTRIPDGAMITVDGSQGIVRIEDDV
jgi:pyruvate,water dikinase